MLTKPTGAMINAELADLTGDLPAERISGKIVKRTIVSTDIDIPYAFGSEISAFRTGLQVTEPGLVFLTWMISMAHRAISAGANYDPPLNAAGQGLMPNGTYYPIGISGVAKYRRATTQAGLSGGFSNIAGSIGAGQISDRKHHYCSIAAARVPFAVEAGYYYQFSLGLSSHTDAGTMAGVDGAAELDPTGGVNSIQLEYEPGATLEA